MILPFYQQTPLHIAAREGHDYTVECLVKKGADISFKDKDGVSVSLSVTMYVLKRIQLLI